MKYRKYIILAAIAGLAVCIDQVTKMYVHTHFVYGESITVIPQFFDLTYVRNPGAAFGIFSEYSADFRNIFFLSIPPIAMICIFLLLRGLPESETLQIVALSSVFGGAMGNYIDRLRFRYVIDFLDFHYKRLYTYPAFNVADICIVLGIIVLFYIFYLEWQEERKQTKVASQK